MGEKADWKLEEENKNMSEAVAKTTINMSREQAWKTLRDLTQAHNYVPGIIKTELTTEQTEGVGASRKVYQGEHKWLEETVTEWHDGHGFKIRLHKGKKDMPFKNAFFEYRIDDAGDNATELTMTMGYTPPMGMLGKGLDKLFLNKAISGVINDVALSMKLYYESGKPTSKEALKAFKNHNRKSAIA